MSVSVCGLFERKYSIMNSHGCFYFGPNGTPTHMAVIYRVVYFDSYITYPDLNNLFFCARGHVYIAIPLFSLQACEI